MILKMSLITTIYVLLTMLLWKRTHGAPLSWASRIGIGVIFGLCAVLSTHFGVDYKHMMLNVRDLGPLSAGLFFDPVSGILAGLIGGAERYVAGTFWGIGSYTRIACSLSTCLAGFLSALLHVYIFRRKKPSAVYAFFMGAVMEVFHMYVVFITHRDDMSMAFYVVKTCSIPMIVFTGLGMAWASTMLRVLSGEWRSPFRKVHAEEVPVSHRFQIWLFVVTCSILLLNFVFSFTVETQAAVQDARSTLSAVSGDIRDTYLCLRKNGESMESLSFFHVGSTGTFDLIMDNGSVPCGAHTGSTASPEDLKLLRAQPTETFFRSALFGTPSLCRTEQLDEGLLLLTQLPDSEMYASRDAQAYENAFADILLFAVIYVLISQLVQAIVVRNLELVNASLGRITSGHLDEVVNVRNSSEFASLSHDINQTVSVLKGYIQAAEKRIEQELEFARRIQDSALPKNFHFPRHEFEVYATMHPAKEVGGDFYDFFFVDKNKLALVIADVSGKGIPAALFMMRSKTALRGAAESGCGPAETLRRANAMLCEGNDAEMFVTVWMGIIDLGTGVMQCANAGHEYPLLRRSGGDWEVYKDRHGLVLAAMEGVRFREYELKLNSGDQLFVYTDGIPEAINEQCEAYDLQRLVDELNAEKDQTLERLLPSVRGDIRTFVGPAEQFDDITMLGFTYLGQEKGVEYG